MKLSDIDELARLKNNLEVIDDALEKMSDPKAQISATVQVYDERYDGSWNCDDICVEWRLLKEVLEKQKLLEEDALREFGVDVELEED